MEKKIKVCFINSVCGFGSTGRIVEDLASMEGIDSLIIYGRNKSNNPKAYRMTNLFGNVVAAMNTVFFNKNGLSNKKETYKAIDRIKEFNPDIIHLHNLHGYYINYEILFKFLKEYNKPVIWTLHDCWSFTGYCSHFDYIGCDKYKTECNETCPFKFAYPFSIFKQNIKNQYYLKKYLFNSIDNLMLVTTSNWHKYEVCKSFLKTKNTVVVNNGIKTNVFTPICEKSEKFTILFVSNIWTKEKGTKEIKKLIPLLDESINITIVGKIKDSRFIKKRCRLIKQTSDQKELAKLYSESHLLINPTLEDVFGLVNVESLSCGTPVVSYNTGGVPEILDRKCGIVVEKRNVQELADVINNLRSNYWFKKEDCINRSKLFTNEIMLEKYMKIYKENANV